MRKNTGVLEIQEGGTGLSGEGRQSSGCPDQASLALTVQPQPASDSEGQQGSRAASRKTSRIFCLLPLSSRSSVQLVEPGGQESPGPPHWPLLLSLLPCGLPIFWPPTLESWVLLVPAPLLSLLHSLHAFILSHGLKYHPYQPHVSCQLTHCCLWPGSVQ